MAKKKKEQKPKDEGKPKDAKASKSEAQAKTEDRPQLQGRLFVTRGTPVVLTNFVGAIGQGRTLREEDYTPVDWKALKVIGKRYGWTTPS